MSISTVKQICIPLIWLFCSTGLAIAQEKEIPAELVPWEDWATWNDQSRDCPTPYNNPGDRICFWPSRLTLNVAANEGSWTIDVTAFTETWIPLPGSGKVWPVDVRSSDDPAVVVARAGVPSVRVPAGQHRLSGNFKWVQMPQWIAIPQEIGVLSLVVEGVTVPTPTWDEKGDLWLKRTRADVAGKDDVNARVYRVLEDGIPIWLLTHVELTVSGKSREEDIGWVLPQGWELSSVESPIPVSIDALGRMKAQVRAGKWIVSVRAFRTNDATEVQFAADAQPITDVELVGFKAKPSFRMAEIEGLQPIDVTQTTFPDQWRNLPVYQWETASPFLLVEKMRGMGLQRPAGLSISRRLWLDESGQGLTFRDEIKGQMQRIWRLDVADGEELGAVRIQGEGQLITTNPKTGAAGVEIRTRNLDLHAIGRIDRMNELSAVGWQSDADALNLTLVLPPGWRLFALFGADRVQGDWLTEWTLLDLFLLLVFSMAVFRIWGLKAGLVAILAFGLAYHEPGAPRYVWFFLLIPLALLRVVPEGKAKKWIAAWRNLAVAVLVVFLIPFAATQIQSAIYPQLETPGIPYATRGLFGNFLAPVRMSSMVRSTADQGTVAPARFKLAGGANLLYDPKARIQTGPAEPEWTWNVINCVWNGPVTEVERIRPIFISPLVHRALTVARLILLAALLAILLGVRKIPPPRAAAAVAAILFTVLPSGSLYAAQIPDKATLDELRQRLLAPPDAYPRAAELTTVSVKISAGKIVTEAQVHAAIKVAVPIPGRLPTWSPISVKLDDSTDVPVCRKDGYLWVVVPQGIHTVIVEGMLPDVTEWEWTYLLNPRRVSIEAADWNVTGLQPNGIPKGQVFFVKNQQLAEGQAAYDRKDFNVIVAVNRHLEAGLEWKVRTEVTRLSSTGRAVSLQIPLLPNESVISSSASVEDGSVNVSLGAGQDSFTWESELPAGQEIRLNAQQTDRWVERWYLVTSPVWNVTIEGLPEVFEQKEQNLIPTWNPWPGENVLLSFSRPEAVAGETITARSVSQTVRLGSRERKTDLALQLECSLGSDFVIELDKDADITLKIDGNPIPVRRDGIKLIVPVQPGKQTVDVTWRSSEAMQTWAGSGQVRLPVEASNITTVMQVPESRWVLWADGPVRGPAVRFWTILVCAIAAALILGSLSLSPLRRIEWVLLAIGLTQVHVISALLVVGWLFLLAWRGQNTADQLGRVRFNLLQILLVLLTAAVFGILITVVGEGLLGNPEMFIVGNGSTHTYLQWFQPRAGTGLPEPWVVSVSVWFYRLLMLFWALWLASALIRWLKWGWNQYSQGGLWAPRTKKQPPVQAEVVK